MANLNYPSGYYGDSRGDLNVDKLFGNKPCKPEAPKNKSPVSSNFSTCFFPNGYPPGHKRRIPELAETTTDRPAEKATPLAASPQPAAHYSQYKCPICNKRIGDYAKVSFMRKHVSHYVGVEFMPQHVGANFIGNLPCKHRGPCINKRCVEAYYGTESYWSPYEGAPEKKEDQQASTAGGAPGRTGDGKAPLQTTTHDEEKRPLYCQAPGCWREIKAWCLVEVKEPEVNKAQGLLNIAQDHPEAVKAQEESSKRAEQERENLEKEAKKKKDEEKYGLRNFFKQTSMRDRLEVLSFGGMG